MSKKGMEISFFDSKLYRFIWNTNKKIERWIRNNIFYNYLLEMGYSFLKKQKEIKFLKFIQHYVLTYFNIIIKG